MSRRLLRAVGEAWALPWTLVGVCVALATWCEPIPGYYWLAPMKSRVWDYWSQRWGFRAITIGTVTICADLPSRELLEHERRHQRQARILGPFYVPAYLLGCVVGWMRGDWYRLNPMEQEASRG